MKITKSPIILPRATIWLGGAGNYGMMMECYFDDVLLGDENLLTPKPAMPTFTIILLGCVAVSIIALTLIVKRIAR